MNRAFVACCCRFALEHHSFHASWCGTKLHFILKKWSLALARLFCFDQASLVIDLLMILIDCACVHNSWWLLDFAIDQFNTRPGWIRSSSWRSAISDHLLLTSACTQFRTQWQPIFYAPWVLMITRIGWWIDQCNKCSIASQSDYDD